MSGFSFARAAAGRFWSNSASIWEDDPKRKGEKEVADQNGERTDDHRLGRSATDAHRAFFSVEALMAAHDGDDDRKTEALRERHLDVAFAGVAEQVAHEEGR